MSASGDKANIKIWRGHNGGQTNVRFRVCLGRFTMDVLGILVIIVVVIVALAAGYYAVKPEHK